MPGLDQISTFRKMIVYEKPGDRFMVLLSAGNLSVSQSVREILQVEQLREYGDAEPLTIWNATSMYDVARVLGSAIRHVHARDAEALRHSAGIDFNASMMLGGQIKGEGHAPVPGLLAGQLHRSNARDTVFPDWRIEIRQAGTGPRHHAGHTAERSGQVRPGIDGFDPQVQPVGGFATGHGGV